MEVEILYEEIKAKIFAQYPLESFEHLLVVWVPTQQLMEWVAGKCVHIFDVSTAALGTGSRYGSCQTPTGFHFVREKHGDGVPEGGILVSRIFSGEIAPVSQLPMPLSKDYITSRILWLSGVEEGKNKGGEVDSFQRYIYIHGTAEEGLIGTPASHGCIRMKNKDVITLFNRTPVGTAVLICDF